MALLPTEIFHWTTGQPVSFQPPPDDWNRSRYQNGGAEGVDFVKAGSKGEQILVAERFFLGRRDHCARILEILDQLDNLDLWHFNRAMQKARLYVEEPYNANEERTIEVVNYTLDRAKKAYRQGDRETVRRELAKALEQAGGIRYTVGETVGRVLFTRKGNEVYPALEVDEPVSGQVAGQDALIVNFTFDGHGSPMVGCRIYVVKNNRMFEFGFQGLPENLVLFQRIVDSVTFPPGGCEH